MQNNGWVKLYRKLLESNMYKNLNAVQRDVMINCLLLANHQPNEWEWKGKIFECQPGQFITSLSSLKTKCAKDVTIQNIRTAIDKLEKWNFLTNESTKTGRLITIVNWDKYQHLENEINKATNKQLTNNQQTANKQLTINKNVKNVKNDKEVNNNNIVPKNEIKKIYKALPYYWKDIFEKYIAIYESKNKSNKITTSKHYRLLSELYYIFRSMKFKYNKQEYEMSEKIFEYGIKEIIKKRIDNLNYCKKVWISTIEKGDKNAGFPKNDRGKKEGSSSKSWFQTG